MKMSSELQKAKIIYHRHALQESLKKVLKAEYTMTNVEQ